MPVSYPHQVQASRLSIRLFGTPVVERNGVPVAGAASQRRITALLALLACDRGTGVSRDRLVGLLWPDAEPDKARHALSQLVYHTRRVLGEAGLIVGTADLRLDPAVADVDVVLARAAVQGQQDDAVATLHAGPLLDGFYLPASPGFEQWLDLERRRLLDEARQALDRLASGAISRGETAMAITWLTRRLTLDPLDSVAAERLAEALLAGASPADAARVIDTHERLLRHELDVSLPPGMQALRLRLSRPTLAPPAAPERAMIPEPTRAEAPMGAADAPPPAVLPLRRRRWQLAAVVTGIAAATTTLAWLLWPPAAPASTRAPAEIAIAPFRVHGASPALLWLADGMVELLTTRLEEASGRNLLDAGRSIRLWRRLATDQRPASGPLSARDEVQRFGREAPARFVVAGAASGDGSRVMLDASLTETATGRVVATGRVAGPIDSIDALAVQLAAHLAATAERVPVPSTPVHSLSAVRRYLAGREAERRGALADAALAYEAAVSMDTLFAEAALRLAYVAWRRNAAEPHDRALSIALAHRQQLGPSDQALLTAVAGPRYPAPALPRDQRAAWELLASRLPDEPDAWRGLGLLYLSHGPVLGMPAPHAAARAALERALALDPTDAAAWRAMAIAVIATGDTAAMRRVQQQLPDPPATPVSRAMLAHARGDTAVLRRAVADFVTADRDALRDAMIASQHDLLPRAIGARAGRLLAAHRLPGHERTDLLLAQHSAATQAGQDDVRRRALADLDAVAPGLDAGRRLRVLDALVLGVDTTAMAAALTAMNDDLRHPRLDALDEAAGIADQCVLALAAAMRGQRELAESRLRDLRQLPSPRVPVPVSTPPVVCASLADAALAVSLGTRSARRRVAEVDALTLSGAAVGDASRWADLLIGRWYAALGDTSAALGALRRRPFYDGWPRYRVASLAYEAALARR